jgi:myo-inositol-1(or 4)-monophosphatase
MPTTPLNEQPVSKFVTTAAALAREAGALLRSGYGQALEITHKGTIDLVTQYDQGSEAILLGGLRAAFPTHSFNAEESGRAAGDDYEWFIDPLDGTTNFAHGFPVFSISVALAHRRRLIAGVVYDPLRDELYTAEAGQGAFCNGVKLQVSAVAALDQALLCTGFPYDVRTNPQNNLAEFAHMQLHSQGVRRPGSAALDLAWMAAGKVDGYWEYRLNPWDVAAGALLVREAGGRVTTFSDDEDFLGRPTIAATNGHLHAALLGELAAADRASPKRM